MTRPVARLAVVFIPLLLAAPAALRGQCDSWSWLNPSPQGNALESVVDGAGQYVAVGRAGAIIASRDGSEWDLRASGSAADLFDVAYDGTTLLAVGASGTVLASADARSWEARSTGISADLFRLVRAGSLWVAVGSRARS
jgi:hypothetical protein